MALERRALLLALVAVCALLLAVGLVGSPEAARDHGATDAAAGGTAATPALITGVAKQIGPVVLIATVEEAAARRDRRRLRPAGRPGAGRWRGRRPASGPGHARGPRERFDRPRPRPTAHGSREFAPRGLGLDELLLQLRY
jgi:hypothetical protein